MGIIANRFRVMAIVKKRPELSDLLNRTLTAKEMPKAMDDAAVKAALKGVFKGNCNVTACQKPSATYFNYSTRKYYCAHCAYEINRVNRRHAYELYGHDLLIKDEDGTLRNQPR